MVYVIAIMVALIALPSLATVMAMCSCTLSVSLAHALIAACCAAVVSLLLHARTTGGASAGASSCDGVEVGSSSEGNSSMNGRSFTLDAVVDVMAAVFGAARSLRFVLVPLPFVGATLSTPWLT